ncbi:hypothetical protein R5W60_16595 [Brucella pseudintermedia]|uniref:hypothetical protein n=1 Tax=Brucella pseudintermedia TaxID=370111 RepID=UPI0036702898|nr:hypothetical protein R5W60_16595 [Brucella pseudintermedia]
MSKLTPKQTETLHLICEGQVYQQKFGYGAWRIQGAHPTVVGKLISLGLARWGQMTADDRMPCIATVQFPATHPSGGDRHGE